jgi:hypothetical protein
VTGQPVAAAPFAQIAGKTPKFDVWGDIGDLAWGLPPGVDYRTAPGLSALAPMNWAGGVPGNAIT